MARAGLGKVAAVLALTLVACSSADAGGRSTKTQAASATTTVLLPLPPETSTSTSTSSTTEAPTTTAVVEESATASIARVKAIQERLVELGYDVGTPDGRWGARMTYSLMAFQKVEGLTRDGKDGAETQAALASASRPGPMVPGGAPTRIEIDVARQVLFHWVGGSLARILPVSTGNNERYCVGGKCEVAVTPGGSFRIGRKAAGLEVSPLGELWWPMYFNGGIAIHGSPSIPPYPASHGCIRIPMYAAASFYGQVGAGTRVHVLNSPEAQAPPDEGRAVPNAVAPPDTEPPQTARDTAPPKTAPPKTAPPDTAPPKTAPPRTAPPETVRRETTTTVEVEETTTTSARRSTSRDRTGRTD